jgi:hypothetical protein
VPDSQIVHHNSRATIPEPQIVGPAASEPQFQSHKSLGQLRRIHNSRATNRWASCVGSTIAEPQIVGPAASEPQFQSHKSLGQLRQSHNSRATNRWASCVRAKFQSHKSLGQLRQSHNSRAANLRQDPQIVRQAGQAGLDCCSGLPRFATSAKANRGQAQSTWPHFFRPRSTGPHIPLQL